MVAYYQTFLALHIIAIISWMAGVLYLYRILIYASQKGWENDEIHQLLGLMAFRLSKYIMIPAMVCAWIFGTTLVITYPIYFEAPWFQIKLLSVVLLSATSLLARKYTLNYKNKAHPLPSSKRLRYYNEIPTVLMIVIVFMVVLKPFS